MDFDHGHYGESAIGGTADQGKDVVRFKVHRALCSLFQPDTDGTRVSKCRQFSLQRRGLDLDLFQCWSSAVGGGPILKQH